MLPRQILTLVALLTLLTGCESPVSHLIELHQEKIQSLERQLQDQAAARAVEFEYFERQASVAAGCDWLIPVCADSVANPGRDAQRQGYGGATHWPFWAFLVFKSAMLIIIAGSAGILTIATYSRFLRSLETDKLIETLADQSQELHDLRRTVDFHYRRFAALDCGRPSALHSEGLAPIREHGAGSDNIHAEPPTERPRTLDDL